MKLSQIKGVSAAGARRRNPEHSEETPNPIVIRQPRCHPERSEGPMQVVMLSKARRKIASPNPVVILSEAKDPCNESW